MKSVFNHHDAMKHFAPWLAAAAIIVVIFGTMYGIVQQDQRSSANDPQIELAEDTAVLLNQGMKPTDLVTDSTDMAKSLSLFVNIYDLNGTAAAGSGLLNGQIPTPPMGLLTRAKTQDFSAETWQPNIGTRVAAVTVKADKYYVVAGRSIKQIEINENRTFEIAFGGGLLALGVLVLAYIFVGWKKPKKA